MMTAGESGDFLTCSSTCRPFMSGIRTSSRIRSMDSCWARRNPGSPAGASITWYPHSSHFWRSDHRTRRSSSTTRIFSAGMLVLAYYGRKAKASRGDGALLNEVDESEADFWKASQFQDRRQSANLACYFCHRALCSVLIFLQFPKRNANVRREPELSLQLSVQIYWNEVC